MFFNEVLFGFYKNFYSHLASFKDGLSHTKTSLLIENAEQQTLQVIDKLRSKNLPRLALKSINKLKSLSRNSKSNEKRNNIIEIQNVNPMLMLLFKGMCLKSWKNYAIRFFHQKS